jgi:hypothetical protein
MSGLGKLVFVCCKPKRGASLRQTQVNIRQGWKGLPRTTTLSYKESGYKVDSGLTRKHWTRLEGLAKDKNSCLSGPFVKMFYNIDIGMIFEKEKHLKF